MLGVLAYYHYFTFSLDDFALFANLLYGRLNFHFCNLPFELFHTPSDASFGKVVYRHLNGYAVTGQNTDIIHSKLTGYMCGHYMTVRKLYLEGGAGQCLCYYTFKFNNIILWQNNHSLSVCLLIRSDKCCENVSFGGYYHRILIMCRK